MRGVVFGLLAAEIGTVRAADISEVITCYGHDGSAWANNTRCPGSDPCCGVDATCLSNRLYHNFEDRPGSFIRGLCAVKPWGKGLCPQICEYGMSANAVDAKDEVKTDKSTRRFPRVTIRSDGSFCSDKDGIACCGQKKGGFLDKNANIVNSPATTPLSWGPEHTPSGYQTIATTAGSASQTLSPTPKPDPNDNNVVKISEGVGIPVGVIAIGVIAALFFMRRGKRARVSTSAQELPNKGGQKRPRIPGCRPNPRN
ncbi:hypothetical protein MGU_09706 [Metarhizium guizhouense ARSEF 977]|uniref:Uncharacterized protein n=1 Tax=Metarhizium guizhouense (strain ARSEF 977) TaxID=1276136 RepID=A0A0B4G8H0_METGA|nr:hypothetical protein MGU_09706 [Metarhizium guizhouense ARSEF 977]